MTRLETEPAERDIYDLFWIDAPEKPDARLEVEGHLPRDYPMLHARYLPGASRMAFSSSQGVSLVSIPDGELLGFWRLAGDRDAYVVASPDGRALVAIMDWEGLFYIPLPEK